MAIRRRQLSHRIAAQGSNMPAAMGTYHPAAGPGTVMVMPLALVRVVPSPGGYGDTAYSGTGDFGVSAGGVAGISYTDVTTMWGPNGEPIPATVPGGWGQLRAAGRP